MFLIESKCQLSEKYVQLLVVWNYLSGVYLFFLYNQQICFDCLASIIFLFCPWYCLWSSKIGLSTNYVAYIAVHHVKSTSKWHKGNCTFFSMFGQIDQLFSFLNGFAFNWKKTVLEMNCKCLPLRIRLLVADLKIYYSVP